MKAYNEYIAKTEKTQKELAAIAHEKAKKMGSFNNTCAYVGARLKITGQSVRNLIETGRTKHPNGYLMEALIEEFKSL
jgi:hypothetical protein